MKKKKRIIVNNWWYTVPHGGLTIKDSFDSNGKGKSENGSRISYTKPEKKILFIGTWRFLGLERLTGSGCKCHLNRVANVQQTRCLDQPSSTHRKVCKK